MSVSRRHILKGLALAGLVAPFPMARAYAQASMDATLMGLDPASRNDQTAVLQRAIDTAAGMGQPLFLPTGRYRVRALRLPSGLVLHGMAGTSVIEALSDDALFEAEDAEAILIEGLGLDGAGLEPQGLHAGLMGFARCRNVTVRDCAVSNTAANGLAALASELRIDNCRFEAIGENAVFSLDGAGVSIGNCTISDCGNGGIRIWRSESGPDGAIVTGNRISAIAANGGGNGQNGNGVNVFRADEVIVADNHIADCAFTAVRLNATNNTQIRGNTCLASGEVAIFSEFEFSGSVIADNIVDGAAAGISMTNYIDDGRLATCTGNIVRNITPFSAVNPDTHPYGIAAEADAVVAGNVVEAVPGIGIMVGWGPYLRDVTVNGNLVRDVDIGVLVSVAEGAGAAHVTNNMIRSAAQHALAASRWMDIATGTLQADAAQFPQLTVSGNTIG